MNVLLIVLIEMYRLNLLDFYEIGIGVLIEVEIFLIKFLML